MGGKSKKTHLCSSSGKTRCTDWPSSSFWRPATVKREARMYIWLWLWLLAPCRCFRSQSSPESAPVHWRGPVFRAPSRATPAHLHFERGGGVSHWRGRGRYRHQPVYLGFYSFGSGVGSGAEWRAPFLEKRWVVFRRTKRGSWLVFHDARNQ